ncbi:MAG: hypothetical protein ACFCD0_17535, partial [Gemmataceae bacterium]
MRWNDFWKSNLSLFTRRQANKQKVEKKFRPQAETLEDRTAPAVVAFDNFDANAAGEGDPWFAGSDTFGPRANGFEAAENIISRTINPNTENNTSGSDARPGLQQGGSFFDWFGIFRRDQNFNGVSDGDEPSPDGPFDMFDDSDPGGPDPFPGDDFGFLRSGAGLHGGAFGILDDDIPGTGAPDGGEVIWVFDVGPSTNFTLSVDVAGVGVFEAADFLAFDVSVDGGNNYTTVLEFQGGQGGSRTYGPLESGNDVDLFGSGNVTQNPAANPLTLTTGTGAGGATTTDIIYTTFTGTTVGGGAAGNQLYVRMRSLVDSSSEYISFDNVTVDALAAPGKFGVTSSTLDTTEAQDGFINSSQALTWTIVTDQPINDSTLDAADFMNAAASAASGTFSVSTGSTVDDNTFEVTFTPDGVTLGDVQLMILDCVIDSSSTTDELAEFVDPNVIGVDDTAPSVVSITPDITTANTSDTINYTVEFNAGENVDPSTFTDADLDFFGSTAGFDSPVITQVDGDTFNVAVTVLSPGDLILEIDGSADDLADNTGTLGPITAQTVTVTGARIIFKESFETTYNNGTGQIYRLELGPIGTSTPDLVEGQADPNGFNNFFGRHERDNARRNDWNNTSNFDGDFAIFHSAAGTGANQLFFEDIDLRDGNGDWADVDSLRVDFLGGANAVSESGGSFNDIEDNDRMNVYWSFDGGPRVYVGGFIGFQGEFRFDDDGDGVVDATDTLVSEPDFGFPGGQNPAPTFTIDWNNLPASTQTALLGGISRPGIGLLDMEFEWVNPDGGTFEQSWIDCVTLFAEADTTQFAPVFFSPDPAGANPDIEFIASIGGTADITVISNPVSTITVGTNAVPLSSVADNGNNTATLTVTGPNPFTGDFQFDLDAANGVTPNADGNYIVRIGGAGGEAGPTVTSMDDDGDGVLEDGETLMVFAEVTPVGVGDPEGDVEFFWHGVSVGTATLTQDPNLQLLVNDPDFPGVPAINAAGTSYTVGDQLIVDGGIASPATVFEVTSVGGSGEITGFDVIEVGSYVDSPSGVPTGVDPALLNGTVTVTGGSGTGATFDVQYGDIDRSTAKLPLNFVRDLVGDLPGGGNLLSPGYHTFTAVYTPTPGSIWRTNQDLEVDSLNQRVDGEPYTTGNVLQVRSINGFGLFANSSGVNMAIEERETSDESITGGEQVSDPVQRISLPSADADGSDTGMLVASAILPPQQSDNGALTITTDGNYVVGIANDNGGRESLPANGDPRFVTPEIETIYRVELATGDVETFLVETPTGANEDNRGVFSEDGTRIFFGSSDRLFVKDDITTAGLATEIAATDSFGVHGFGGNLFAGIGGGMIGDYGDLAGPFGAPTTLTGISTSFLQDFFLFDLDPVADWNGTGLDTAYTFGTAGFTSGALEKYSLVGGTPGGTDGTWTLNGTINAGGGTGPTGTPGWGYAIGEEIGSDDVRLFIHWGQGGSQGGSSTLQSRLYGLTDTNGYNQPFSDPSVNALKQAVDNPDFEYAWRGIAGQGFSDIIDVTVDKLVDTGDGNGFVDGPVSVAQNTTLTYQITVTNAGPNTATNLALQDLVPFQFGVPTNISTGGTATNPGTAAVAGLVTTSVTATGNAEIRPLTVTGIDSGTGAVGPFNSGIRTFGTPEATSTLFQNIEGSGTAFPTFLVQDWVFPGDQSIVSIADIRLSLFEDEAAFSANGDFDIYLAGPGGLDPNLRLAESNPAAGVPAYIDGNDGLAAVPAIPFDTANATLLGTATYAGAGVNGNDDDLIEFSLESGGTTEEDVLLAALQNGGTFRLLLVPDEATPNVAATYAGQGNIDGAPPTLTYDVTSQAIDWTGIELGVGESATLTYEVDSGTTDGTFINSVEVVSADQVDLDETFGDGMGNDYDEVEVTVQAATGSVDVGITKVDSADPVNSDASYTYTVTVTNTGPDTATNVVIDDVISFAPGVTGVSVTSAVTGGTVASNYNDGGNPDNGGTLTIASLPVGDTVTLTITLSGTAPNVPGTVTNTATLTSVTETDTNNANDSDAEQTTINPSVTLSLPQDVTAT